MIGEKHIIKVDQEITPLHYLKRTEPVLEVGADYYVCFGNNIAYPCTLTKIIEGTPGELLSTNMIMVKFLVNILYSVMK